MLAIIRTSWIKFILAIPGVVLTVVAVEDRSLPLFGVGLVLAAVFFGAGWFLERSIRGPFSEPMNGPWKVSRRNARIIVGVVAALLFILWVIR